MRLSEVNKPKTSLENFRVRCATVSDGGGVVWTPWRRPKVLQHRLRVASGTFAPTDDTALWSAIGYGAKKLGNPSRD